MDPRYYHNRNIIRLRPSKDKDLAETAVALAAVVTAEDAAAKSPVCCATR